MTAGQERALDELWSHYGIDLDGKKLDFAAIFDRSAPIVLEIGFGDGSSLLTQALERSEQDFVGIEVHRPGIGRLLREIEREGLRNVRVIRDDAVRVLEEAIPEGSLERIQIFFPDPWPKKRHHKRRLVQPELAGRLARALRPGGTLHLATDWQDYAEHMRAVLEAEPRLENAAGPGSYWPPPPPRPATKFEHRGERLGHRTWDLIYRRIEESGAHGGR
jgi:tRNA (guanine-N7-)-methyltransferase